MFYLMLDNTSDYVDLVKTKKRSTGDGSGIPSLQYKGIGTSMVHIIDETFLYFMCSGGTK